MRMEVKQRLSGAPVLNLDRGGGGGGGSRTKLMPLRV